MSYLKDYIRHCLLEEGTHAFGEYPLFYDPETVITESDYLREGFGIEDMELAYFSRGFDREVNGAAWVRDTGKLFEFAVVTSEDASDFVFSNLVRDCMEEYATLRTENPNLILEVKVEDCETENHLHEFYGLSIIRQDGDFAIMSFA